MNFLLFRVPCHHRWRWRPWSHGHWSPEHTVLCSRHELCLADVNVILATCFQAIQILQCDSLHRSLGKTITHGQCINVKQDIYWKLNTIIANWNDTMQLQYKLTRVPFQSSLRLDQISQLLQQDFTDRTPFPLPNSQHQSSEGKFYVFCCIFKFR